MDTRPRFTHLHTHSHYSLLDGLAKVDQLVNRAKELGMDSLAITDHGVLYGAIEFYKTAKKAGVKPILGVEAYIAPRERTSREPGERYYHLILLCENEKGWKNLIKLVSRAHLEGYYYKPRMDKELLREYHEGLIALSACMTGEVNRALLQGRFEEAVRSAREYQDIFGTGNFFLEIGHHPHIKEMGNLNDEIKRLSRETGIPMAATQDIHYLMPEDSEYHEVLLAVQTGTKLTDDDRLSLKEDNFSMTSPEYMYEAFADIPEAASNTAAIADRCNVTLELGKVLLPHFPKPDGKSANAYLRELTNERIENRYPGGKLTPAVTERLEYELSVIENTGFADYFLIVQDLINWAKSHGISVGPGRGSAAGSITAYILGITDIDPLQYDLLFERFLNPDRIQMPDIDIDFADTRRDEVLAYARQKYGEDHVAQIITFGTMAARAAIRDAGRAMALPYGFCDQLAKLIPFNTDLAEAIENVSELKELYRMNEDAKRLLETAKHLEGVARHASVHACGTVISKESLTEYVPLQFSPQDKTITITQFEMHAIEDLGLLKIDFLGLRNLTTIQETVRLVRETRGVEIDMSSIPLDDRATFTILRRGDTTGVFQFESGGMRRYMKEMKPTSLEDLIALVALYRPGPMELIPTFIKRKHGLEKSTYLHPKLEPILANTYGIGVYQEQMMQIARSLAGFSLAEADTLRKAIGKKIKSLLDEQKQKLIDGMTRNGIDARTANAIWELFPPFARYGFNKSHAACYALIGYQTAYLKAHYPQEFTASLLNAELDDIERIAYLVAEARMSKIEVLPPDVNASFTSFTPQENGSLRYGILGIKNVGEEIAKAIITERTARGPFNSFADFLTRIQHKDLNKKSLESLAKAGAFDSLGVERNQIIENMDDILKFASAFRRGSADANQHSLFGTSGTQSPAPTLHLKPATPATTLQRLAWEKELIGFYLSDHPLNSYKEKITLLNAPTVEQVCSSDLNDNKMFKFIGLVSQVKKITTKTGQPMAFATVEDFSRPVEVVVFNSIYAKTNPVWDSGNVVLVQGKMSWRDGEPKMIVDNAKIMEA